MSTNCILVSLCASVLFAIPAYAEEDAAQARREREFAESLSGAVLVGTFSIDGVELGKSPFPERYELKSVKKAEDGLWTFTAHVVYLNQDITVPVNVPVVWAGDTPMISLSDGTLPGLGSQLSARVIFHEGRYAGTWKHGDFGGHMWGKIERPDEISSEGDTGGDDSESTTPAQTESPAGR